MNKLIAALTIVFSSAFTNAQTQLIPDSVYFVMEVDLGKIIKSIPIEDINKFEVVKNNLSHLTDVTNDITDISQLGIDFNSKLIAFASERESHSSTTVIIPIQDRNTFIQFFDELDQMVLKKNDPIVKDDFIIVVSENECVITSMKWKSMYFSIQARDLFEEKGWELPYNYYNMYGYDYIDYDDVYYDEEIYYEEEYAEDAVEGETVEEDLEIIIIETEEPDALEAPKEEYEEEYYENSDEIEERKRGIHFQEVMDSIIEIEKKEYTKQHLAFLDNPTNNLISNDQIFEKISAEVSDAKIYYNPSVNPEINNELKYLPFGRFLYQEFNEFRQFAYLNFTPEGVQVDWKVKSSENLGKVFNKAASGKLNKNLLKYIPDYAQGFGIYNINSLGAYEQLKEIYLPILDASEDGKELLGAAIWSTIDEFLNMEAVTSIYPPQMLFTYGGLKEVQLSKVSYEYDEETFQYTEVDTTYMEKIPMVTFVLANERAYLVEKYLKAIMKLEEGLIQKNDNYYTVLDDPLRLGIPYYLAIKDDIILITNDENAVKNNLDGYDKKAFDRSVYKKAKNSKMFYAHLDLSQMSSDIASLGLYNDTDEFLTRFEDKTAKMDFEVTSVDKDQVNYCLKMETNEKYKNGAYFLFELINEIYIINK
jgi:hypothetical protein